MNNRHDNMAVGELVIANDCSAVFGSLLLYNKRLPDHKSGMKTMQKAPKTSDITMLSHRVCGPPQPRNHISMDS